MSLPKEFLTDIARKYELSPEQEEVFVEFFSSEKSDLEIAKKLYLSYDAVRTRMTNVYQKFSIKGKGPGKKAKLLNFLVSQYPHTKLFESNQVEFSEENISDLVEKIRLYTREKIIENCGTMLVLDMSQPIELNDIYLYKC
ncbi:MAG: hypothetical protein SWX82_23695 [Cyanobacteriota bacterium]|nr:hypothetical protein [Cyanobacteriota bacterium]